jgi:hypothetical protein
VPFTLSHAAAVLPFRRTRLITSALVVGCFAPDFEYFIPFGHHGHFGHTIPGVFGFDLPLSLGVLWLFWRFAREPLAACLPEGARARLHPISPDSKLSIGRFTLIVLSILVGIATHLIWDSFTHSTGWITEHVHFLRMNVSLPLVGPRSSCDILQYFSSAFGIIVILLWCVHWYRNTKPVHSDVAGLPSDKFAIASSFVSAGVIALIRAAAFGLPDGVHGAQRFMANITITGITVLWIEIVLYGVIRDFTLRNRLGLK